MVTQDYKFKDLINPITIGKLTLKNRIVLAPAHVNLTASDGEITSEFIEYLERRAAGGAAMIIMGVGLVREDGRAGPVDPRIDRDRFIPGLYKLTERIHFHDCLACAQLFHAGRYSIENPISASDVEGMSLARKSFKPQMMTKQEIEDMTESFAAAAVIAKRANFDLVEIHGATGYLVLQFYSPRTNKRVDEYGGSFEKRIRFPLEIVMKIKQKCGKDFPVGFRMVGDELFPDGFNLEEAKKFAKRLEESGVAYISVTYGTHESRYDGEGMWGIRSPVAPSIPISATIKKEIGIPVMANGQITDPIMMEQILKDEKADLIALARPIFSDPDLPVKICHGKHEEIRKCTHCCLCLWNLIRGWPVTCFQNPEMGKEKDYRMTEKASRRKQVLIIGGGPGGLETARVAALRGHKVTLWEKENKLGGQLSLASLLPGKEVFKSHTIDWLCKQCETMGVKIELSRTATIQNVKEFSPEAVIIATGASPHVPDITGSASKNVWSFKDVLTKQTKLENKRVVIIGGGMIGTEMSELLAIQNNFVILIEMLPELAVDMDPFNRAYLLNKIRELNINVLGNTKVTGIYNSAVACVSQEAGDRVIECDDIVIATGTSPNNSLIKGIGQFVQECHAVGDCLKPRRALNAIHEGSYFGRMI